MLQTIQTQQNIRNQDTTRRTQASSIVGSPIGGILSGNKKKEQHRQWYLKNRDKVIAKSKENYQKNRRKIIERSTNRNKKLSKEERKAIQKKYYQKYPEKYDEHKYLSRTYKMGIKLSYKDYKNLVDKQKNLCAICGEKEKGRKSLAIDHCHKTGKMRKLLCKSCNTGLGFFKDDTKLLERAIIYLQTQ
jgi:hypothetical protein